MTQPMPTGPRPLPQIDPEHEAWWAGLRRHELLVQECPRCRTLAFPPEPACPACRSLERGWRRSSGRGSVFSWVVVRRASHPYFSDKVPYAVALVTMEEGFRVVGSFEGAIEQLRDGLPVEAGFEDVNEQVALLRFRVAT